VVPSNPATNTFDDKEEEVEEDFAEGIHDDDEEESEQDSDEELKEEDPVDDDSDFSMSAPYKRKTRLQTGHLPKKRKHSPSSEEPSQRREAKASVKRRLAEKKKKFVDEDLDSADDYCCPLCKEDFGTGQALGGHMSRAHPGKSEAYNKKIEKRRERKMPRAILREAKRRYYQDRPESAPLNRVVIRRMKRKIADEIARGDLVLEESVSE